jgi:hypothetical protein
MRERIRDRIWKNRCKRSDLAHIMQKVRVLYGQGWSRNFMQLAPMTMRFTPEAVHLAKMYLGECLRCHRTFAYGDTTHIGYAADGRALCVGDCCSNVLVETAIRNFYVAQPFQTPQSAIVLWRYMDLAKFVGLLSNRRLFFSRLD